MAYGVSINTSDGFKDIADASSGRVLYVYQIRAVSGSVTVSNFDDTTGFFFVMNRSGQSWNPEFFWDNSTKIFSWGNT